MDVDMVNGDHAKMNGDDAKWSMNQNLEDLDPEVFAIIQREKRKQTYSLEMIASENFTSRAVLDCMSSCLHNKYSEGQPGARYYGGNEHIDNHLVLIDLRNKKLSGSKAERILEDVGISVNKNTVPGDKSAFNPSGIRFGTPPLTTRGFKEDEMKLTVQLIDSAFKLALEFQAVSGPKLVDWKKELLKPENLAKIDAIKKQVETLAIKFPLPGREHL